MHPMPQANTMNLKHLKSVLLGTSALVCLALATPVMADDFVISSSDGSTNGNIAPDDIDGSDTVSLGVALLTTGDKAGIETTNVDNVDDGNTITISDTGSIKTAGDNAHGIASAGNKNITTVSGSIKTGDVVEGTGEFAYGIWNEGNENTTTVSGSIKTTGDYAGGIVKIGDDNRTTVSDTGSIETAGDVAFGIANFGNENRTTVSGSI